MIQSNSLKAIAASMCRLVRFALVMLGSKLCAKVKILDRTIYAAAQGSLHDIFLAPRSFLAILEERNGGVPTASSAKSSY